MKNCFNLKHFLEICPYHSEAMAASKSLAGALGLIAFFPLTTKPITYFGLSHEYL